MPKKASILSLTGFSCDLKRKDILFSIKNTQRTMVGTLFLAEFSTKRNPINTKHIPTTKGFEVTNCFLSRARSLRNLLVSGNECGRVFPAGVGPGSPSRDAANWLPSRFSLSVETRRRYGWLRMMVFPGARLFPSPNLVPFGRVAARERQGALSRRAW